MARNSYPRAASLPSAARTPDGFMRLLRHNSAFDIHDRRVLSLASSAITQATTSSPGDRSSGAKFTTSRYRSWPTITASCLLGKRIESPASAASSRAIVPSSRSAGYHTPALIPAAVSASSHSRWLSVGSFPARLSSRHMTPPLPQKHQSGYPLAE